MIEGAKFAADPNFKDSICLQDSSTGFQKLTYQTFLEKLICQPPTESCYMFSCSFCGNSDELKQKLLNSFEDRVIDKVMYKSWLSVDRTTLETIVNLLMNSLIFFWKALLNC